jgi:hypothetical protein
MKGEQTMRKMLSREQLGEIRLAVTFFPPGLLATRVKQLLGHIDAQADLINDQATMIARRDATIAAHVAELETIYGVMEGLVRDTNIQREVIERLEAKP